jgi:hypothetical protein
MKEIGHVKRDSYIYWRKYALTKVLQRTRWTQRILNKTKDLFNPLFEIISQAGEIAKKKKSVIGERRQYFLSLDLWLSDRRNAKTSQICKYTLVEEKLVEWLALDDPLLFQD